MANRYKITLTKEERAQLTELTRSGKSTAAKFIHARALLLCDAGEWGERWKVADAAEALGITSRTLEHLKQRFVEEGLDAALARRPARQARAATFDASLTHASPPWRALRRRPDTGGGRCGCSPTSSSS